ncbi:hypothetical protein PS662_02898 [Pseudomonas fluorescens]|uniref:Uncharacterized protein n=1 Tax=Pseudomonas fluorescens TaxID=294 RepID=A0A5E6TIP7_PSEFL|nr:hypothetical protein [Pseudomonas fluorescens]VVM39921.1 hypothetical protein PS662_00229 [Pseudomonas fluorescens]VVM92362.1 hypothetical protein PS662_02898 [Pseudomonas fluorescens]
MTSANPSASSVTHSSTRQALDPGPSEPLEQFLGSFTETTVVFRYLDLLAERTQALEQRIGLNELHQLRRENKHLREQVKKGATASMDLLTLYLPIIYHNFWNTVRPDELAMLAGSSQIPAIPSPYTEPDGWLVMSMKQRFLQLSGEARASVIAFCHQMPYPLTVRRSMQSLLEPSV